MYLISAYFDDNTNKIIKRYIETIAKETGNTFMTDNNVCPHLTISSLESRNEELLIKKFAELENEIKGGSVHIVSVGQLLPYVMYVSPYLNEYLSELSNCIYNKYKGVDEINISRYYKPLSWLPHITVGKQLEEDQMIKAFRVMQKMFVPVEGKIVKLGIAKTNPHRDIRVIDI